MRVAEEEERSTMRDKTRLARDLEEIAAARAERTELMRELDSYGELHAEFQRLEVLAREEGRRQALIETGQALADELHKLRQRRQKVESAPKLDLEVSALLEERREELELVDGQLEARRTEWVRDRQEAET
jgi:seryl-tRNA synthetase